MAKKRKGRKMKRRRRRGRQKKKRNKGFPEKKFLTCECGWVEE